MVPKKKKKPIAVGDVVKLADGSQLTVRGYLVSTPLPTDDQLRPVIAPLFPSVELKIRHARDVAPDSEHQSTRSADDQIMWGT